MRRNVRRAGNLNPRAAVGVRSGGTAANSRAVLASRGVDRAARDGNPSAGAGFAAADSRRANGVVTAADIRPALRGDIAARDGDGGAAVSGTEY